MSLLGAEGDKLVGTFNCVPRESPSHDSDCCHCPCMLEALMVLPVGQVPLYLPSPRIPGCLLIAQQLECSCLWWRKVCSWVNRVREGRLFGKDRKVLSKPELQNKWGLGWENFPDGRGRYVFYLLGSFQNTALGRPTILKLPLKQTAHMFKLPWKALPFAFPYNPSLFPGTFINRSVCPSFPPPPTS